MLQTQRLRAAHADSRLPQILDAAAQRFCTQGYQGTTIRDIARAVGILPGSLYCHFATKQDLLAAVYTRGVDQICQAVQAAVDRRSDPWERLEAACVAHLEAILRDGQVVDAGDGQQREFVISRLGGLGGALETRCRVAGGDFGAG